MIRLNDAAILAVTKLRTRRIRTSVTVVISGLLFAGLIAVLIVARGAENSIAFFNKEGLNSRYIVATSPNAPATFNAFEDPNVMAAAQQIYDQTVADKKAAAKQLGIAYDPSTEPAPTVTLPAQPGRAAKTMLSFSSPAAQQALQNYADAHPVPGLPQLKAVAKPYHPIGFYQTTSGGPNGTLSVMQNGQEDFSADDPEQPKGPPGQSSPLQDGAMQRSDPQLTKPFLLPNQPQQYTQTAVPIILSYARAQKLLGMQSLPKGASPAQKLSQIKELYRKAQSITIAACYRNSVSEQQIQTAITQAADIAKNTGNAHYQKPELVYGLPPADSCGPATILRDVRSASAKKLQAKQDEFDKMFGKEVDPVQQKLTFRVVGLTPDQNLDAPTTFSGILRNIVGSSLNQEIVVPSDMLQQMPNAATVESILFPKALNPLGFSPTLYYAEFTNADDARNFINNKSCTTRPDGACATATKPFQLNTYGSNSIALDDLRHKFLHFFEIGTLVVMAIAVVIMTGTIGRMIADGRRETAVFRAIGAKRLDIATIYTVYTFCLSLYVALFALIAGVALAYVFDHHFWLATTVQAQLLFGASDTSRSFHFFSIDARAVGLVLLIAIACGLVSMLLPLLRNVRRSPIKDMREE